MARVRPRLLLATVVFGLCPAFDGLSQENKPAPSRVLPGNGVADPAGKTGFFPNTTSGIDALDLANGKVLWSSKDANRPLLATADRLIAQKANGNQLRIVAVDTSKEGQRIFESPAIPLPAWANVDTAYGRVFRSGFRQDKDGFFLIWEARAFYAGGAPPPPELIKRARKDASGVARVDLDTGKIEELSADKIAAGKFFPIVSEPANPKVGMLDFGIKDGPAENTKNRFANRRTLQAMNEAKEIVWEHDIALPIFLPPLP